MSFDTERVIVEVHCRPAIWNQGNELYKDRDARTAAWLEICNELFENFENYNDAEKKTTGKNFLIIFSVFKCTIIGIHTCVLNILYTILINLRIG